MAAPWVKITTKSYCALKGQHQKNNNGGCCPFRARIMESFVTQGAALCWDIKGFQPFAEDCTPKSPL